VKEGDYKEASGFPIPPLEMVIRICSLVALWATLLCQ